MKSLLRVGNWVDEFIITEFIGRKMGGKVEHYAAVNKMNRKYIIKVFANEGVEEPFEWATITKMRSSLMFCPVPDADVMRIGGVGYRYMVVHDYSDLSVRESVFGEGKRYKWKEAAEIIQQVLEITQGIHNHQPPVIHNNINPSTVGVECGLEPLLVQITGYDYISPVTKGKLHFNPRSLNMWYRAPETFDGVYNEQTDIFSIGALMYFMLMGREPWSTPADAGSTRVSKERLNALRMAGDEILYGLMLTDEQRYILHRMLALKSKERYRTVEEALGDLINGPDKVEVKRFASSRPKSWVETYRQEEDFSSADDCSSFGEGDDGESNSCESNFFETPGGRRRREESDEFDEFDYPATSQERGDFTIRPRFGRGFAEVAGMEEVKRMLRREVMFVIQNKEKALKYRLKSPNGALFYGPPGCGKTFIAEKFAEESKLNFMMVKASDLGSIYVHGTQCRIAELFEEAARKAPTVICFDELDGMVPDRASLRNDSISGEVNEFLSQLNNCAERGIFVIGTSNRPDKIDPAILRTGRIDKMVYIPLPDFEARREMFRIHLEGRYCAKGIDYDELATLSDGYVASDISFMVNESALEAAMADEPISQELLVSEIGRARRAVTKRSVEEYATMRERLEQKAQQERRRIGF